MTGDEIITLSKQYTLTPWVKQADVNPLPIAKAEGVYIYTSDGKKILDFNSQLMSVLIGHGHKKVIAAMKQQLDEVIYVYPGMTTEPRAKLGKLLAEITPGDINTFFFTLGGAEANENAIKAARFYTGRHKILSRYRSYHGATHATMQMTGDPRRWASEPGAPGFIRVMDPQPYTYSFGTTDEEKTANNLRYLEEVIMYEGPQSIAAMFIETVTGTNGVLAPPKGYLQGLRALLDTYGILLVCDEVMAGFGRTGKMFAFEHGDIVPDMVTMAKGLTSSYFPLGAVGMRDKIAKHFHDNVFSGGLTYAAHPLGCATAVAVIEATREDGLVENAAKLGGIMRQEMDRLHKKHPSIMDARNIGLFGMIDLRKNSKNEPLAPYNGSHPAMGKLNKFFLDNGLFTFTRWNNFTCNPPLCITEQQLREGFAIIDRGLEITDGVFES
ncbi:MAG: aminotransferase class III-fold pyridoxal phosphate-dependent enzyme [Clostridia bacterium]|nr:aminotransferase class III-fold pyridoxal phosphate-dependent enzyme [Deltaproteobacteria bacterium]